MQQRLQDGSSGGEGGRKVSEPLNDGRNQPLQSTLRRLLVAGSSPARRGKVSDAALEIVNRFYVNDLTDEQQRKANWHASSPYWQRLVCVLAERCARAEHLAEIERSRRFGGGESDDKEPVSEDWLQSEYDAERGSGDFANRWIISKEFPTNLVCLERSWKHPDTWLAFIEDDYFPIDIYVREQVRLLVRMCQEL